MSDEIAQNLADSVASYLTDKTGVKHVGRVREHAYESSEALVEAQLGRGLGEEHALMRAARRWLKAQGCPQAPNARGRGRYLVSHELARRFRAECWPQIKHLARP
jgi:hypothetical protein